MRWLGRGRCGLGGEGVAWEEGREISATHNKYSLYALAKWLGGRVKGQVTY